MPFYSEPSAFFAFPREEKKSPREERIRTCEKMSSEAPENQTPAAPAAVATTAPTVEAVPKDAPGAPSASNITEGIEKMNLNPSQQPGPTAPVESTTRSEEKPVDEPLISRRNLIINYLPPNLTEGNLATLFSPYGALEECKIVIDLETGRSRGYGFVKYANEESAANAKTHLNGYHVENKRLKVAYARKQCKEIQNANLYVTNIPPHYDEGRLKTLFADFGEIIECRILRNDSGQSRGVGFVRLDTHVHAMTALQDRDGFICEEGAAPLVVKLAQRRKRNNYGNWNHTDGRSLPRQGGGREPTSPGQSGRNPRYSGGMSGRRVGGIGASSFGRDPMNDYQERRRDDRQDRRDVRSSPGFRGRGRGGYGGGFNSGRQHRGRGGPAMMGGMHGPPNGSMGSGRMQQQPQQYRTSGRGMAGPYGRGNFYYAQSNDKMGAANAFPGSR